MTEKMRFFSCICFATRGEKILCGALFEELVSRFLFVNDFTMKSVIFNIEGFLLKIKPCVTFILDLW